MIVSGLYTLFIPESKKWVISTNFDLCSGEICPLPSCAALKEEKGRDRTCGPGRFFLVGEIVEISLDEDDGRALVSAAARQVAQAADQVGQAAGSGALRLHRALEVGLFVADVLGDGLLELAAREVAELVVREVFELDLVGQAR